MSKVLTGITKEESGRISFLSKKESLARSIVEEAEEGETLRGVLKSLFGPAAKSIDKYRVAASDEGSKERRGRREKNSTVRSAAKRRTKISFAST